MPSLSARTNVERMRCPSVEIIAYRRSLSAPGLLLRRWCANLDFCAVGCVKRECAFMILRMSFGTRGGFPGGLGLA